MLMHRCKIHQIWTIFILTESLKYIFRSTIGSGFYSSPVGVYWSLWTVISLCGPPALRGRRKWFVRQHISGASSRNLARAECLILLVVIMKETDPFGIPQPVVPRNCCFWNMSQGSTLSWLWAWGTENGETMMSQGTKWDLAERPSGILNGTGIRSLPVHCMLLYTVIFFTAIHSNACRWGKRELDVNKTNGSAKNNYNSDITYSIIHSYNIQNYMYAFVRSF